MNRHFTNHNNSMSNLLKIILLVLLIAAAYQTYQSRISLPISENTSEGCIVKCPRHKAHTTSISQLCLTSEYNKETCFYVDNIILFKSYNGKSVVYDYDGNGQYVKENLKEIEEKISMITSHFYQINRQDLVNMIYAEKLDKCKNTLFLCGEFDCNVPRRKTQDVEKLMHRYCSLMCH